MLAADDADQETGDGKAGDDAGTGDGTPGVDVDLAAHTVAELRSMAEEQGVEVPPKAKKDEIIAALDAATASDV
jgi:hypothetical protein